MTIGQEFWSEIAPDKSIATEDYMSHCVPV